MGRTAEDDGASVVVSAVDKTCGVKGCDPQLERGHNNLEVGGCYYSVTTCVRPCTLEEILQ